MLGENILQSFQKIATLMYRVDQLTEEMRELRTTVTGRLEKLESQLVNARERLTRLEVSRDADRAQMQANLARFQAEVERAELRLTRLLPTQGEPHQLLEQEEKR